MLVSVNWLKKYVPIKCSDAELVDLIGSRLVEVENTIDLGERYQKIYIVKVSSCEAIPGTHLHLCSIDAGNAKLDKIDGQDSHAIQVLCGAPNVHTGMLAVWIAPGATVPQSIHEDAPFVIGKRKMLGKYQSYGMLSSTNELDIGDDQSGIVELAPDSVKPGTPFADAFELNDTILNIENKSLTHRPDAFGIIGFAREVAGITGQKFIEPKIETLTKDLFNQDDSLKITLDTKLCPRYTAIILEKHGNIAKNHYLTLEQTYLARSGMRAIDPIVDATNYFMLLNGQPLHAFDYDKFISVGGTDKPHILVRAAKPKEQMKLLDGSTVEMTPDDIVITSNDVPVALAGAMGGNNTTIDEHTTRVILESATFNLFNLRRTQMAHGVFSEAIQRFTKGQPASQTLNNATVCANSLAPILRPVQVTDYYPQPTQPAQVKITLGQINDTLGTKYTTKQIETTLANVGFIIKATTTDAFEIQVPNWRTDIAIPADIIEEIGRLNGYDNIQPVLPLHQTAGKNILLERKTYLHNLLAAAGANEVLTYSFIPENLMQKVGQDTKNSFQITNSISPDLQYIRQTLVPSLLQKTYINLKAGHDKFVLFEINQVFSKNFPTDADGIPMPEHHIALVAAEKKATPQYYQLKLYIQYLAQIFGLELSLHSFTPAKDHHDAYYEPKRSASLYLGDQPIGVLGELKASVAHTLKLPQGTAAAELKIDSDSHRSTYIPEFHFGNYPKVERDVTLTPKSPTTTYAELYNQIEQILQKRHLIYTITPLSIYQADQKSIPNTTFRLSFTHPDKTLNAKEISVIMEKVAKIS